MTFLIEVKLYEKSFDIREVKQLQDIRVDINELSDKRLIVITKSEIIILLKENNEYIIKEEYPIDKNWNIGFDIGYTKDSEQYFHSYELPKNRIVILSHSKELCYQGDYRDPFKKNYSYYSKIIFIYSDKFKEIKSTEIFQKMIAEVIEFEKKNNCIRK